MKTKDDFHKKLIEILNADKIGENLRSVIWSVSSIPVLSVVFPYFQLSVKRDINTGIKARSQW
jgi:hypothetical protein